MSWKEAKGTWMPSIARHIDHVGESGDGDGVFWFFSTLINMHKSYVDQFRYMGVAYQMEDTSTAPVVISSEAFLTLKRLNNELEEVIETIEILNTPQLMKQIERSKKDVKAGRVCELSGADDLDSIWK